MLPQRSKVPNIATCRLGSRALVIDGYPNIPVASSLACYLESIGCSVTVILLPADPLTLSEKVPPHYYVNSLNKEPRDKQIRTLIVSEQNNANNSEDGLTLRVVLQREARKGALFRLYLILPSSSDQANGFLVSLTSRGLRGDTSWDTLAHRFNTTLSQEQVLHHTELRAALFPNPVVIVFSTERKEQFSNAPKVLCQSSSVASSTITLPFCGESRVYEQGLIIARQIFITGEETCLRNSKTSHQAVGDYPPAFPAIIALHLLLFPDKKVLRNTLIRFFSVIGWCRQSHRQQQMNPAVCCAYKGTAPSMRSKSVSSFFSALLQSLLNVGLTFWRFTWRVSYLFALLAFILVIECILSVCNLPIPLTLSCVSGRTCKWADLAWRYARIGTVGWTSMPNVWLRLVVMAHVLHLLDVFVLRHQPGSQHGAASKTLTPSRPHSGESTLQGPRRPVVPRLDLPKVEKLFPRDTTPVVVCKSFENKTWASRKTGNTETTSTVKVSHACPEELRIEPLKPSTQGRVCTRHMEALDSSLSRVPRLTSTTHQRQSIRREYRNKENMTPAHQKTHADYTMNRPGALHK